MKKLISACFDFQDKFQGTWLMLEPDGGVGVGGKIFNPSRQLFFQFLLRIIPIPNSEDGITCNPREYERKLLFKEILELFKRAELEGKRTIVLSLQKKEVRFVVNGKKKKKRKKAVLVTYYNEVKVCCLKSHLKRMGFRL